MRTELKNAASELDRVRGLYEDRRAEGAVLGGAPA
jgi:hypothetical protein